MVKSEIHQVLNGFIIDKMRVLVKMEQAENDVFFNDSASMRIKALREEQKSFFDMLRLLDEVLFLTKILVKAFPTTEQIQQGKTARFDMIKHEYDRAESCLLESARSCVRFMTSASVDGTARLMDLYSEVMERLLNADGGVEALRCLDWTMTKAFEERNESPV